MQLGLQVYPFIAGVLSHVVYFNRGEHHLYGLKYLQAHTIAFLGLVALLFRLGTPLTEAFTQTFVYDGFYLAGVFGSLLFYRVFLHPLNSFPGPRPARISSFDMTLRIGKKFQMYQVLLDLHNKYGHFVRIGTDELSITHPRAVMEIFGAESVCEKSAWYDIIRPQDSLHLRRTYAGHAERRSIWSHAFSVKAMKGYEERIRTYRRKLMSRLDESGSDNRTVDLNHWLGLYSWDVLSDLSFGHPFGMLDDSEQHWALKILKKGMLVIGFHFPMWYVRMLAAIPGAGGDTKVMLKYCTEAMLSRYQNEPKQQDVMSHLFVPFKEGIEPWDERALHLLAGESHLLINAGSDTTRVTMAVALFVLCRQPELGEKLREALAPHVSADPDEEIVDSQISHIDYLNGYISEALRLYPPSPSHPTRVTPPEGAMIAGKFIPGGTQLITPHWVIGRDETIFPRAMEFIPERWYSMPELVRDHNATAPFSAGPFGCIGKPFALTNVRVTIASIVWRYNISFAPGSANPEADFFDGMHEHFGLQPGPLNLRLERRSQQKVEA